MGLPKTGLGVYYKAFFSFNEALRTSPHEIVLCVKIIVQERSITRHVTHIGGSHIDGARESAFVANSTTSAV